MIHDKLIQARKNKGETLEKVAESVGITTPHYWMIENGKRKLSYELAVKIANHFGVEPDDIFLETYLTTS